MIEQLISLWIFIAFLGAVITSFNAPPDDDFKRSSGHFFTWIFFPLIFSITMIISLIKWKDLLTPLYHYLFKIVKNESQK